MPVLRLDAAALLRVPIEQLQRQRRKAVDDAHRPRLPILTLEDPDEVIAAHVADEILLRVAMRQRKSRRQPDHLVAPPVAVLVVEQLEMIHVRIAATKLEQAWGQVLFFAWDQGMRQKAGPGANVASDPSSCRRRRSWGT